MSFIRKQLNFKNFNCLDKKLKHLLNFIKTMLINIISYYFHIKGGDSIKEINRRSGAHVEIDKSQRGANATEGADKMFVIRGTSEQIQYAQQLIYEKITGVSKIIQF